MAPHQQRVVDEKAELDEKIAKLGQFIDGNDLFRTLPGRDQELLRQQRLAMTVYSDILAERIQNFGG